MDLSLCMTMHEEMPHFSQKTGKYADCPYHGHTISTDGCGPVAFSMAASWLLGRTVEPTEVTEWIGRRFNGLRRRGTRTDFFKAAAKHYGLSMETTDELSRAEGYLRKGFPVIYYTAGSEGVFSFIPHYLVLSGIDAEGNIYIHNPNDLNDGKAFPRETIEKWKAGGFLQRSFYCFSK